VADTAAGRLPALLRHNRRLGRLAVAVLVSSAGDPLSLTVSLVLLYAATGSPLSIAGAYAAQMLAVLTVGLPLAALADHADRRRLVVRLELARCLLVASLPLVTRWSVLGLYPALYLLGLIEALVTPARQAAVPRLVAGGGQVGQANAALLGAMTLGQALGFAAAGAALAHLADPRWLYLVDAATFAAAALLVATLGHLGGGVRGTRLRGGFARAWAIRAARPLLLVAGAVVFFVGMLNPSLVPLAYALSPRHGPSLYTALEVGLIAGLFVGSAVAGQVTVRRRRPALAGSILLFGTAVLAVALSPTTAVAAVAIALSGVGNAVYSVTNQTALLEASQQRVHGTVMAARFAAAQAGKALGLGTGAVVTARLGARSGFAVIGAGLLVVAAAYTLSLLRSGALVADRDAAQQPADPPAT
jgi:MFS family permease